MPNREAGTQTAHWQAELARHRVSPDNPWSLTPEMLATLLADLCEADPAMELRQVGSSFEGRPLQMVQVGHGPTRVLLWSQMHGDEPTHTCALIDILSLLVRCPDDPGVQLLRQQCTLFLLPMLNPDGAVRRRRTNAQDLDINRDANRRQTPEGRLLQQVRSDTQPDFGFNLHNQNARSTVGESLRQAAVALLVPPLDYHDPLTEQTLRAQHVASCFRQAVEPLCAGRISRYDAGYMPTCFGEWFQAQGTATVLVEAGGWDDSQCTVPATIRLAGLHAFGLAATLVRIADGSYLQSDPVAYTSLPRNGEIDLHDYIVRNTVGCLGDPPRAALVDLAWRFPQGERVLLEPDLPGRFSDMGDLSTTAGKREEVADGTLALPGDVRYENEITPLRMPCDQQWAAALSAGVTTLVGRIDPTCTDNVTAWCATDWTRLQLPGNLAFLVVPPDAEEAAAEPATAMLHEAVQRCLLAGAWGILSSGPNMSDGLPEGEPGKLCLADVADGGELAPAAMAADIGRRARKLRIDHERGAIARGLVVDLQLRAMPPASETPSDLPQLALDDLRLRSVMVGGTVVWTPKGMATARPGRVLQRVPC